eukprot:maker-scaffold_30-snap-gene-0.8-mRNA-1 protein AED:0.00 eAED:0.00 QI:57/1/1/1/1/1/2/287/449
MNTLKQKESNLDRRLGRNESTGNISDEIAQMDQLVIEGMLERIREEKEREKVEINLQENEILILTEAEAVEHLSGQFDERKVQFSRSTKKAIGIVACGAFVSIIFFSASILIFVQNSKYITENNKVGQVIDNGCAFEDIETSKTIVKDNARFTVYEDLGYAYLTISDIGLNCLSINSFDLIELPIFTVDIIFKSVFIGVIAENTFNKVFNASSDLYIYDSKIGIFHDQDVKIKSIVFDATVIKQYPRYFPARKLYFEYISNFIPTINFLTFISSSSKEILMFNSIFDDYTLEFFRNMLIDEKISISFNYSYGAFYFRRNSITYLPKYFLSSDVFKFNSASTTIDFYANKELTLIHEEAFSDFSGENIDLYLDECENITNLPRSIMDLDLRSLDISDTAIEDLEGIDFSDFTNLEELETEGSPVNPACEEEKSFKEQYGIKENVHIRTCR